MEGPRVKATWLEEQFSNPFLADATEVLVQQYARFYILGMLGGTLFMDKSGERVSIMYLKFFNSISNRKNYSWGSAALSWLYRYLYKASKKTAKQIGSALLLVHLWVWARFPHMSCDKASTPGTAPRSTCYQVCRILDSYHFTFPR